MVSLAWQGVGKPCDKDVFLFGEELVDADVVVVLSWLEYGGGEGRLVGTVGEVLGLEGQ